jgi:hypothetical protein
MAFSSGDVLTAANLNDLNIDTVTTSGTITQTDTSNSADIVLTGAGSGYTHASVQLNADGATRGAGVYAFNAASDAVWFFGSPYDSADEFAVTRFSDTTFDAQAADIDHSFLRMNNNGRTAIGKALAPNANRQLFVQSGESGILPYEFHNNRDCAAAAVYGGIWRIGTNSTAPDTGDYWVLIRKGDSTTIGSIRGTGGNSVNFSTTSDQTLKNDLGDAGDVSSIIDDLKIHKFTWKDSPDAGEQIGLFAQEAILVDGMPKGIIAEPATVKELETNPDTGEEEEVDRYLPASLDYGKLVPLLIQEVKSLRQRVATLEG